jgi:crotonobetainyl-CoA:carnitine CoA-transferase CaiB-like acyl-CoA transferase
VVPTTDRTATGLGQHPDYATVSARYRHRVTLSAIVAKWVSQRDRFEAQQTLQAHGVRAATVLRPDIDHLENEHLLARGVLRAANFDGMGTFRYPSGPWFFADSEPIRFEPPPLLG